MKTQTTEPKNEKSLREKIQDTFEYPFQVLELIGDGIVHSIFNSKWSKDWDKKVSQTKKYRNQFREMEID